MRKSTIVILAFLMIIAVEIAILFGSWRHPQPETFSLDEQQYVVAERNAEVRPLLFEIEAAERLQRVAEIIEGEMAENSLQTLFTVVPDLKTKEAVPARSEIVPPQMSVRLENEQSQTSVQPIKTESSPAVATSENVAIAVVIDDVGLSDPFVKELAKLGKPLTAAFLTYGAASAKQAKLLKDSGLEVMLHVPMMPHVPAHLAPITLSPDMNKAELQAELEKMIARYDSVQLTGINNHMGSLLTERKQHMGYVMEILKKHGMFFLDSKTTAHSVAKSVAAQYGVPYIARDVFLDNENNYDYIMGQLRQAEKIARKHGRVVAIGHPHSQTLRALKDWLKDVEQRGFRLVRISDLLP